MQKPTIKLFFIFCGFFASSIFLSTCGFEENYFLPQVPEINISTQLNTSATINLPSLTGFYYAQNYIIFYRIYISDFNTSSNDTTIFSNINSSLVNDYNFIYPNTDPTSTTAGISANNLFLSRSYFELELEGVNINNMLSSSGGNIRISFPTAQGGNPVMTFNNGTVIYNLKRSGKLITPRPSDRYFQNTSQLSDANNANSNNNADVAARSGLSQTYAYVSMYVVAAGTDPVKFTTIYSKPTHISVFRLPEN